MPVFSALMVILLLASVVLCLMTVSRVFAYNKKYNLPEIPYTKLFKVLTKEHFAIAYVVFTVIHSIFTLWFIWTL